MTEGSEAFSVTEQKPTVMAEKNWFILHVKKGSEKKLIKQLTSAGVEYFIPVYKTKNSGRRSTQWAPLFASYVFAKTQPVNCMELKKLTGVINLVYWISEPAIVQEKEVNLLRTFLTENLFVRLDKIAIDVSKEASISIADKGAYNGKIYSQSTKTLQLPTLGYSIVATTPKAQVRVITEVAEKHLHMDESMLADMVVAGQ